MHAAAINGGVVDRRLLQSPHLRTREARLPNGMMRPSTSRDIYANAENTDLLDTLNLVARLYFLGVVVGCDKEPVQSDQNKPFEDRAIVNWVILTIPQSLPAYSSLIHNL